jgi:hypothetical protein
VRSEVIDLFPKDENKKRKSAASVSSFRYLRQNLRQKIYFNFGAITLANKNFIRTFAPRLGMITN